MAFSLRWSSLLSRTTVSPSPPSERPWTFVSWWWWCWISAADDDDDVDDDVDDDDDMLWQKLNLDREWLLDAFHPALNSIQLLLLSWTFETLKIYKIFKTFLNIQLFFLSCISHWKHKNCFHMDWKTRWKEVNFFSKKDLDPPCRRLKERGKSWKKNLNWTHLAEDLICQGWGLPGGGRT